MCNVLQYYYIYIYNFFFTLTCVSECLFFVDMLLLFSQ